MGKALEQAMAAARARRGRLVLPEAEDPRIIAAAAAIAAQGLAEIVPLASVSEALIAAVQAARPVRRELALRMLDKPLIRAAAMVGAGLADAMIAGAANPTRRVIEAAGLGIGLAPGVTVPSSFFLMDFPGRGELIFADCALNVAPDSAALAAIARASAATGRALLGRAEVALLSFSTGVSGSGDSVDLVRAAAEATGFAGPVQADAALNPAIAARKGMAAAGHANVLVFPSLDAGNIAYKLCQELAGAQAIGPILQGFRKPVSDLSRGADTGDIVATAALCLAMA